MSVRKRLPVGIESFPELISRGFYYVDKTQLLKELLNGGSKVNLFTRPRRFGKTLTMSMIKAFFDIRQAPVLFQGLQISQETQLCEKYQGRFPVISLSFKGVCGDSFSVARSMMCAEIRREAMEFQFLQESEKLTEFDKQLFRQLLYIETTEGFAADAALMNSIQTLSILLKKHYEAPVIILIDEYDVPLDKAFELGYYDSMVGLVRNMFGQALKTNENLYFSVLTGCLRISKESIFTGLNNFKIFSITDVRYDEFFGFTDQEVRALLAYYGLEEKYDSVKQWYDGYQFGNVNVYCPWDVICYCDDLLQNEEAEPECYWSNTSSNVIVKKLIVHSGQTAKRDLERLIEGETISKPLRSDLTYSEIYASEDHMWSVLFTTGYLTQRGKQEGKTLQLAIPNLEVREIFVYQISEWFREYVTQDRHSLK